MKLSEEKMQYLKNIRQQLCKGTLSHEDAERFMLDAIEKEAEKKSADYDWIEACCQFLEENIPMTAMQDNWPDHQQSNWESIQVAINDEKNCCREIERNRIPGRNLSQQLHVWPLSLVGYPFP